MKTFTTDAGIDYYLLPSDPSACIAGIDLSMDAGQQTIASCRRCFSEAEWRQYEGHTQKRNMLNFPSMAGRIAAKITVNRLSGLKVTSSHLEKTPIKSSCHKDNKGQPYTGQGLFISISHSKQQAVAIASTDPVGIDIEPLRAITQSRLNYCFSQREKSWINENPENLAIAWSVKEAFLKALGIGIFPYIRDIEVCQKNNRFQVNSRNISILKKLFSFGSDAVIVSSCHNNHKLATCRIT